MIEFRVLLILILAHFIADYPLQTNCINERKKHLTRNNSGNYIEKQSWEKIKGIFNHLLVHFVMLFISIFLIKNYSDIIKFSYAKIIPLILLVVFIHGITDYVKEYYAAKKILNSSSNEQKNTEKAIWYLGDQLVHLITIFIAFLFLTGFNEWPEIKSFIEQLFLKEKLDVDFMIIDIVLIFLILTIINTQVSGFLIGILLVKPGPDGAQENSSLTVNYQVKKDSFFNSTPATTVDLIESNNRSILDDSETRINYIRTLNVEKDIKNYGRYIGYLERSLYMILIAADAFEGIAFIIAIKAVARYKKFDDKNFAEYHLIGSLLSIVIGIINGLILKYII